MDTFQVSIIIFMILIYVVVVVCMLYMWREFKLERIRVNDVAQNNVNTKELESLAKGYRELQETVKKILDMNVF